MTLLNLTTKTNPDSLIFSCILNIGPKSILEYRGRPLLVFEANLTICNILVGTKNKNPIFHVDFIEFDDKNDPDFLIFSCILNIGPKSLPEFRGRPLILFEANLTICNIFV